MTKESAIDSDSAEVIAILEELKQSKPEIDTELARTVAELGTEPLDRNVLESVLKPLLNNEF